MDNFDKKILESLQQNNRLSSLELGEKIGLSATACQRRLKKLRQNGMICKEIAVLNPVTFDNYVTVIVEVVMKQGGIESIESFKQRMLAHQHVQQCYYLAGNIDFIVVITAPNMAAYELLTKPLFLCDKNILKFHSHVVMDNVKAGLNIPV
ncbi:Lrp/AsnC family transcriptional regulator [Thalassomonas actiniarum]|uniref:Lrp/AsnC family transcriptional regulator n=1 Tax=Thalassomonas actiniarum TaxID=485447 RepID=A0AAF0C5Q7_9GAMM|nr:Lrp/AsnC family transcriptional regulator [Thalassomonas actiniarum]WDE01155.1 Lrp/AsnC family transcriptional regulator [Thalassomonas actiniarum]